MKAEYDILIVGGGGSGLAAAVSAAENGAKVVVLEKYPELGGSTGIAVGSLTANRTSMQKTAGIEDSLEAHIEDAALFAPKAIEARNNEEIRNWFLDNVAETLDWLVGMGVNFIGPNPEPPNRVARMHNVVPGAKAYITVLQARLIKLGGTVVTSARVVDLIQEDERICGVIADLNGVQESYYATKGVVLAAGDYTNSAELISRFKGEQFAHIEGINKRALGEGHMLAEKVGAKLENMDITYGPELRFITPEKRTFQQLIPTSGIISRILGILVPFVPQFIMTMMIKRLLVTWQHPEDSLLEAGAILVNQNGDRFCDEKLTPEREIELANQPGKYGFIVLDRRLVDMYNEWPTYISTAPKIGYAYVKDYLRLRKDVAYQGATLEDIARKRKLPISNLYKAVEDSSLEEGPWVILGPTKAYFTNTEGGVMINKQFRVLDREERPIPGLYAIGQNGLSGQILWGHGLHIGWAMTSGRMAGKLLAKEQA
jgi:fumarate reductase flavoprotein subunit